MITTISLLPSVTLRVFRDRRFKQGAFSVQLVRPMRREEAAENALVSAVLLRGCGKYPDMRAITRRLDELYGASVGPMVRRVGDYQTTGLYCGFMEDRFAMNGEAIFAPCMELLRDILLEPKLEDGGFCRDYVEGEKKNLISTLEARRNDKRSYASERLLRLLCRDDSYGIPRLGEKERVAAITPQTLYRHYRSLLESSEIQLFYVGSAPVETVAALAKTLFSGVTRSPVPLPPQTGLRESPGGETAEEMDVAQARLCMGFVTPVTLRGGGFAAMQVMNTLFGGGMQNKLFSKIREEMGLCYDIGSTYHSSKGILTVSAGIDERSAEVTRREVLAQLDACRRGDITEAELTGAKEALLSSLRTVHDTPGSIENYYATAALSGFSLTPEAYRQAVASVTAEQAARAANTLRLHTVYLLKGVN